MGTRSQRAERRGRGSVLSWFLMLAVSMLVVAGCGAPGSDEGGDTGTAGEADYRIDSAGYEGTRTALEAAGWACFDTIEEPSPVRRCYLDARPGDPAGSVTFRFFDPDFVSYINVYLDGVDPGALGAVRDVVATSIGDELLGGAGADLVTAVQAGQPTQVAGVRLELRDPTHFEVIDPAYQEVPFESDILPLLAGLDEVIPQLEQRGFSCVEEAGPPGVPSSVTNCEGVVGELAISLTVSLAGREYEADDWHASASRLAEGITSQQRLEGLVALFQEVGIVGDAAVEVLRGGLRAEGFNADVEGHHVSVDPADPAADFGVVAITVDRRLAGEINS